MGHWIERQRRNRVTLQNERVRKLEQLPGWSWEPVSQQWNSVYLELLKIARKNGRFPSSHSKKQRERFLGMWIDSQLKAYNRGILPQEKIEKLNQIPGWSWNRIVDKWNRKHNETVAFVRKNGKLPPQHSKKHELGVWVHRQREKHKRGKLSQDKIQTIERIPKWEWNPVSERWNTSYEKVLKFVKKNRKFPAVSSKNSQEERSLGQWISNQRREYKNNPNPQRFNKLEQIPGWSWNPTSDLWNNTYKKISTFVKKNDKFPPSRSNLGTWVSTQRQKYRRSKLSQKQIKQMEQMPGWKWNGNERN